MENALRSPGIKIVLNKITVEIKSTLSSRRNDHQRCVGQDVGKVRGGKHVHGVSSNIKSLGEK